MLVSNLGFAHNIITHWKARGLFWGVAWPQDFVVSSGNRLRDLAMAEE